LSLSLRHPNNRLEFFFICPASTRAKNYFWLEKYFRAFAPRPPQVTPVASDVQLFDVNGTALSYVGLL
jgi:hypothetical protein